MSDQVHLGFVEENEPWLLESRFFPSKVGGKPAWLDLKNLPSVKDLTCNNCKNPCIFLCQVYAPYEDDPRAFHRTIFVFICKNPACCQDNVSNNLKVFRSQLERNNEFYSFDPPVESKDWKTDIRVESYSKVCDVCGISATNHCSKCKKVNYCCQNHQEWAWKNSHKKSCGQDELEGTDNEFLFPELDLVIENEEANDSNHEVSEEKEFLKYKKLVNSGNAGTFQSEKEVDADLLQITNDLQDKVFLKFRKKISRQPGQVLRYHRDGQPLFVSSKNQPENIPRCKECGGNRQFEFQIMPQLLNHLKVTDNIDCLDWGILAIYTCKNACVPKSKYVQEFIWKQDVEKDDIIRKK